MKLNFVFLCTLTLIFITFNLYSQEFLDEDKRVLKLIEVSTDKTYGYKSTNPIEVGDPLVGAYLNALIPSDKSRMHIADLKKTKKQIIITLSFEGSDRLETMYFTQNTYNSPKAPVGYTFKTIDDIPKVVKFPDEKIVKVETCDKKIYSVDDFLLKKEIGRLPQPKTNPSFRGGKDELKKYFVEHPLTDEEVKNMIFRVSISFVVNCNGEAGNYKILSKGRGPLKTYANQILAVVNEMPQEWIAAQKNGKNIDSYQVLSFTVIEGKLDKVSYKE